MRTRATSADAEKMKQQRLSHEERTRGNYGKYDKAQLSLALTAVLQKTLSRKAAARRFGVPSSTLKDHLRKQADRFWIGGDEVMSYKNNAATSTISEEGDEKEEHKTPNFATAQIDLNNESVTITANIPLLPIPTAGRPPHPMTYEEEKAFADWLVVRSNQHTPVPRKLANQKAVMLLERTGENPRRRFKSKSGLPSNHWWRGFYHRWPQCDTRTYQLISRGKATLEQHHLNGFFRDLAALVNKHQIPPEVSTYTRVYRGIHVFVCI